MTTEEFNIKLNELIEILLEENVLILHTNIGKKDTHPSKYKSTKKIDEIIRLYKTAKELLNYCSDKKELMYCILYEDNSKTHFCPICGKRLYYDSKKNFIPGSCRKKECLCGILLKNDMIKDNHQFIIDEYLNGPNEFNYIQIGFIEKYGVYNNSQLKIWKEQITDTWSNKTEEELKVRKQKTIATCREKYGCDFSQQNEEIKDKQRASWAKKTDEEHQIACEKRKQTCLEKYGVNHVMLSDEILENAKQRYFERTGCYHWVQKDVEHKDIYMDDEKMTEYVINRYNELGKQRVKKKELDKFFNINVMNRCISLNLMQYIKVSESQLENIIKKLFDDNGIKYQWRNRSIIDGVNGKNHCYELDFYLPDYDIGIEINDLATHNNLNIHKNRNPYSKTYHQYKSKNCKEKQIRLIHIWEWELHNDFDKISAWLLNELNKEKQRIFARKCIIKPVDKSEEKEFLTKYHLQSYTKSKVCYGLYYNDELVQLMSFTESRYNKKYKYELLRLCTKYNYIIIGGSNRLFKHFVRTYNPESVVSYCDFSKYSGNVYENIGMDFLMLSDPTVIYCNYKWEHINESLLMRYGIDNLLGTDYGKGANNKESIIKEGYLPVYNCGNLIYVYKK